MSFFLLRYKQWRRKTFMINTKIIISLILFKHLTNDYNSCLMDINMFFGYAIIDPWHDWSLINELSCTTCC